MAGRVELFDLDPAVPRSGRNGRGFRGPTCLRNDSGAGSVRQCGGPVAQHGAPLAIVSPCPAAYPFVRTSVSSMDPVEVGRVKNLNTFRMGSMLALLVLGACTDVVAPVF